MENNVYEILVQSGFSEKETRVYIAILSLGKGTVSEITKKAGVGRTYGYAILNDFVSKGFVSLSGKEPKIEYFAESPRKVFDYLVKKVEEDKKFLLHFKDRLPDLVKLHNVEDRPKVRFYEGIEGIKEVYEDTLTAKEPYIRGFAQYEELHITLPNYFPEYYKRRAARGIFGKGIITDTKEARQRILRNKEEARETILISKDIFDIKPEIDIYDDKVMIVSWKEELAIQIQSSEIADAMKKIFDLVWIKYR